MKLKNVDKSPIVEAIRDNFENAEKNKQTAIDPVTADAIEQEKVRDEKIKDVFKDQEKAAVEFVKKNVGKDEAKQAEETVKQVKVKSRRELGALISEAKKEGLKYKISRFTEGGNRYMFKSIKPLVEEKKPLKEETVEADIQPEEKAITDPQAVPASEPVTIPTTDAAVALSPEEKQTAIFGVVNSLISDKWSQIDHIKSIIQTLKVEDPENKETISIFETMLDEELIHVGMLNKAIGVVDSKSAELIKAGEEKAEVVSTEPAQDLKPETDKPAESTVETEAPVVESKSSEIEPYYEDAVNEKMNDGEATPVSTDTVNEALESVKPVIKA